MLTVCYSPKGGQGCTAIAVALACLTPDVLLIDTAGDALAAAGIPAPSGAGICDLLASNVLVTAAHVARLAVLIASGAIVPAGHTPVDAIEPDRWAQLAALATGSRPMIVDAGTSPAVAAMPAARRIMVMQACYLALRRAAAHTVHPDAIVLVADSRRALSASDVEAAVGAPVTATVPLDPHIARSIDAGLLVTRLPAPLAGPLAPLAPR